MMKLLCILTIILSTATNTYAYLVRYKTVLSGDTFMAFDDDSNYTIRLYGIDAPDEGQLGCNTSANYLKTLLTSSQSRLVIIPVNKYRDKYGRIQAIVFKDGECINETMIAQGQAWYYGNMCKRQECFIWKQKEVQAKKERTGIWAIPGAEAPWLFRPKESQSKYGSNVGYIEGVYYEVSDGNVKTKDPNEPDLFPVYQIQQPNFVFDKSPAGTTRGKKHASQGSGGGSVASPSQSGTVMGTTGEVYVRDPGSGNIINTQNGSVAVPAGPNGYIDTRTGQFMPAF